MTPPLQTTEAIPRRGRGTQPDEGGTRDAASWSDVEERLRDGSATCWLTTLRQDGTPHTRPLFSAWTGTSFVIASKAGAVKSRNLRSDSRCTLAVDLGDLHVVVEGTAQRVTDAEGLARASTAMLDVYGWPTVVAGDELDAEYGAPTSGGPPYQVYEVRPRRAFAFPMQDQVEPTRWTFAASD